VREESAEGLEPRSAAATEPIDLGSYLSPELLAAGPDGSSNDGHSTLASPVGAADGDVALEPPAACPNKSQRPPRALRRGARAAPVPALAAPPKSGRSCSSGGACKKVGCDSPISRAPRARCADAWCTA
jgi:hypothetical protein